MKLSKNAQAMKTKKKGGQQARPCTLNRSNSTTLTCLADQWIDYLVKRNYSDRTTELYYRRLLRFLKWVDDQGFTSATEISKKVLESYQTYLFNYRKANGKKLDVGTQRCELNTLKRFFEHLCKVDHIEANPASVIDVPRKLQPKIPKAFSREEVKSLMGHNDITTVIGVRNRAIMELVYATGARRATVTRVKLEDYDRDNQMVTLNAKAKKVRIVPLSDSAVYWMNKYLDGCRHQLVVDEAEDALFITGYGTALTPVCLGQWFAKVVKKIGIKTGGGIHRLRHSTCTHLLENGCDIGIIAQIVGHEDITSTQIYTKLCNNSLKEAYRKFHPSNL